MKGKTPTYPRDCHSMFFAYVGNVSICIVSSNHLVLSRRSPPQAHNRTLYCTVRTTRHPATSRFAMRSHDPHRLSNYWQTRVACRITRVKYSFIHDLALLLKCQAHANSLRRSCRCCLQKSQTNFAPTFFIKQHRSLRLTAYYSHFWISVMYSESPRNDSMQLFNRKNERMTDRHRQSPFMFLPRILHRIAFITFQAQHILHWSKNSPDKTFDFDFIATK